MKNRIDIVIETLTRYNFQVSRLEQSQMGCNLMAHLPNTPERPFLIFVASSVFLQTERYKTYLHNLEQSRMNMEDGLPIVLMLVNEANKNVMLGISLYWKYDKAFINSKPNFRRVSDANIQWLSNCINGLYNVIEFLNNEELRVVKKIDLNDDQFIDAHIIYLRNLTDTYKMKPKNPAIGDIEHSIYGTPQNEYPRDLLDDVVFNAVKEKYPQATIESSLKLFGLDIVDLENQKLYTLINNSILIIPVYYHPITGVPMQLNENSLTISLDIFYHHKSTHEWLEPNVDRIIFSENIQNGNFTELVQLVPTYHQLSKDWM